MNANEIRRHGNTIRLARGVTATEGYDGLPTLTIRSGGKVIKNLRGSSLVFGHVLSQDDKDYLAALAK